MSKEKVSNNSEAQVTEIAVAPPSSVPSYSSNSADDGGAGSIDRIRDILFGEQSRDYDRRLAGLEDRLLKELAAMQEDSRRRFDAFETYVKTEIDALNNRLRVASEQREEMNEDLNRKLHDSGRTLEKRITQLDEHTAQAHRDLRQQILEQSKALSEEIRVKYTELANALAREAQGLRSEKTDRSALASFFGEIAKRLDQDPSARG
jgi:DNA repair exonuclease SbcCD ATPase subunit